MMMQLAAWWRARSAREQRLIQIAAALIFAVLVPAWAYTSAAAFREGASSAFASARHVSEQVEQIGEAMRAQGGAVGAHGSVRDRAMDAALAGGVTVSRLEPAGADRVRVVFAGADSRAVYRWIEAMGRRGVSVQRSEIIRVGDSDLVNAEFEVADAT